MSTGAASRNASRRSTLRLQLGSEIRRLDHEIDRSLAVELAPSRAHAGDRGGQRLHQHEVHQLTVEESLPKEPDENAAVLPIETERDDRSDQLDDEEECVHEADHH